jgi:hypothetical protein
MACCAPRPDFIAALWDAWRGGPRDRAEPGKEGLDCPAVVRISWIRVACVSAERQPSVPFAPSTLTFAAPRRARA